MGDARRATTSRGRAGYARGIEQSGFRAAQRAKDSARAGGPLGKAGGTALNSHAGGGPRISPRIGATASGGAAPSWARDRESFRGSGRPRLGRRADRGNGSGSAARRT